MTFASNAISSLTTCLTKLNCAISRIVLIQMETTETIGAAAAAAIAASVNSRKCAPQVRLPFVFPQQAAHLAVITSTVLPLLTTLFLITQFANPDAVQVLKMHAVLSTIALEIATTSIRTRMFR